LRIAQDISFVAELAAFRGRFEIYLQFDGFKDSTYANLRGREDLLSIKLKAIDNLRRYKIPITLVSTIKKDVNDDEIGKIFEFAVNTPGIRGITFQPVAFFGRSGEVSTINRVTLSGIIERLAKQTAGAVKKEDIVPLPCNVDRIAVSYFYKDKRGFEPLTRRLNVKSYLPLIDNTLAFDAEKLLKENKKELFTCCCSSFLKDLGRFIPKNYLRMDDEQKRAYWDEHSFRITIVSFLDRFNFDMKSIKKECLHFITPDLKRVPFSSYNMLHRKLYK